MLSNFIFFSMIYVDNFLNYTADYNQFLLAFPRKIIYT